MRLTLTVLFFYDAEVLLGIVENNNQTEKSVQEVDTG